MHCVEITKDKLIDADNVCSKELFNVAKTCIETSTYENTEIYVDSSHFTIKVPFNSSKTRALIWSKIGDNEIDDATFWSDGMSMRKVHNFLDLVEDITNLIGKDVEKLQEMLKEKHK